MVPGDGSMARDRGAMIRAPYRLIPPGEMVPSERFEVPPVGLVLLGTLEVVVRDALGHYLLVLSPRYEPVHDPTGSGLVETGQWTPPYVQYDVPAGSLRTVGSVYQAFRDAVSDSEMAADLNRYLDAWQAGLHGAKLVDELIEYKNSWSQPGAMKVYCIRRHRVITEDCDVRALADSDMRQGFRFLPIGEAAYASNISLRECPIHRRTHSLYLGRPLATDLAKVTARPEARAKLRSEAIEVPREAFFKEYSGLLFCGDVANYGAACRYVSDHMGTLIAEGAEVAEWLRESAITAFTRIFLESGISHVHTAGDGFICALPTALESREALGKDLARFLNSFRLFCREVDDLERRISAHRHTRQRSVSIAPLGTRLAVHLGSYRYGKMGLAASLTPAFDGASIIDVARLEQGLRDLTKTPTDAERLGLASTRHPVALSDALVRALGRSLPQSLRRLGSGAARSKESKQRAHLFVQREID
jgi:hypothetical protein